MAKRRTNRAAWGAAAILAAMLLVGAGLLLVRLRPYWVAKYRGKGANLRGVVLVFVPLSGAAPDGIDLRGATLRGANLSRETRGVNPEGPRIVRGFPFRDCADL